MISFSDTERLLLVMRPSIILISIIWAITGVGCAGLCAWAVPPDVRWRGRWPLYGAAFILAPLFLTTFVLHGLWELVCLLNQCIHARRTR
jgi:hypothetical protein